ncbi:hypothetical protein ACVIW2_002102 [Bradyrhizobium huanghuaihaiense]|uniref:hypothetical protein n=1 Tax=Bradyrhizobium sp. B024 TaxID=3140247 RepID=UPI00318368F5
MAISNDEELGRAVRSASDLIQDIHEYCKRTLREDSKVKFPRGLIGTANSYREKCPGYLTPAKTSSCAYGFMHLDVLWWLSSRTDLVGISKQMLIKSAIVTLGMLTEAVLWIPGLPQDDRLSDKNNYGVKPRLDETKGRGWITDAQCTVLRQLWDHRNNVHIKFLENSELDLYKPEHINEPYAGLLALMKNAKEWDAAGRPARGS